MTDLSQKADIKGTSAVASAERRQKRLVELHRGISKMLSLADTLSLPFVAIHFDHAAALCYEELAKAGEGAGA